MFATIGDLISYLFHITVKINLQTFGTLMALAFAGAYVVFVAEFKRKEADGTIHGIIGRKTKNTQEPQVPQAQQKTQAPQTLQTSQSPPSSLPELLLNIVLGFLLGYKGWHVLVTLFHGADPAPALLSLDGNLLAGIMLATVWGIWVYMDRNKTKPTAAITHPYQLMPYITFMVACWGFLGAKLFDAVEHFQELRYEPLKVLLARSGFTYYGGLIFGALTYLYIGYRHKIKLIHMADIGSPGMMLAYGIGRIGCQLSGDGDWGIVNKHIKPAWIPQWAWASTYPHNAIDAGVYIPGCTWEHCHQLPVGVFPTPLYESTLCILLFATMWLLRKRIKTPGAMFCLFLILNGTERFFIEMLRITPKYQILDLRLSQAQMIALLFIAGGLAGSLYLLRPSKKLKMML